MNIGMGGADVSLGTVTQSIAGLDAWRVNAELWTSKEAEAHKYTSSLRTLYSVGGAKELALYKEILSGMTNVEENAQGAYSAKTEAHGDGTKTIYIGRDALADGSRFGMNILLAHESYRNGVDDGEAGQRKETDHAVLGHINTALALGQIYGMNSLSSLQANEVNTYVAAIKSGQYGELAKILNSYESSADYWRVLKDKDGNVTKVLDDSDRENVTIVEADGTERKVKLRTGSVSGAIAIAVGNGMTPEQMNKITVRSGLDWTEEKGWYAKDENAKYTVPVTKVTSSQSSFLDQIKEWSSGAVNQVGNWLTSLKAEIKNIIVKNVSTNQEKKNDKATFEIVGNAGIPLTLNSINTDNPHYFSINHAKR
jgi:hypothetical protein